MFKEWLRHRLFVKKSIPAPIPILEFHSNSGWSSLLHSGSCAMHNCGLVLPWLISNQCCHFWFFNIRTDVFGEISNVWCFGGKPDIDCGFDFCFSRFLYFWDEKCKNYNFEVFYINLFLSCVFGYHSKLKKLPLLRWDHIFTLCSYFCLQKMSRAHIFMTRTDPYPEEGSSKLSK